MNNDNEVKNKNDKNESINFNHIPVMLTECIDNLNIQPSGVYVDGTLGGGGHSFLIAENLDENGTLIGIDQDDNALSYAKTVLFKFISDDISHDISEKFSCEENSQNIADNNKNINSNLNVNNSPKIHFVKSNFSDISNVLSNLNINEISGILLDLGVSSHQLDESERGFSYMKDAPLDMRMNRQQPFTAFDVVNTYDENSLIKILKEYGEEKWASRIAKFIIEFRNKKPIETTLELVDVIQRAIPKAVSNKGSHPAKKTFQAIRIEVNNELKIIESTIRDAVNSLSLGGRICIITFHSLEDRIVKNVFRDLQDPCTCPKDFPVCVCGLKPKLKLITRKPIVATNHELDINSRSKSAKLRVAEKI